MGGAWKRTFPRALKDEIWQFLNVFVDAFVFPKRKALKFAPASGLPESLPGAGPARCA
jgi:hypothetical protein